MASVPHPASSKTWQALGAAARSHVAPLSFGRARPLLAAASSSLLSTLAGPSSSTSFATSQRFTRSASSAEPRPFTVGQMYSHDPILGRRAKVLNDWNARHESDPALFEDSVPEQYATLRLGSDVDDPRQTSAAETSPAEPLLAAVLERRWVDARDEFQALHASGATVPFNRRYLQAAVTSLVDHDIDTPEDRLEWFILWLSLVPVYEDVRPKSLSLKQRLQHSHITEQLLCFPTHLSHLSRILVLLTEKGLGSIYGRTLLPHVVQFSPPGTALALVDSMCAVGGWRPDSFARADALEAAAHQLLKSRMLEEAVEVVRRGRLTSEPHWRAGLRTPTFRLKTLVWLRSRLQAAGSALVSVIDTIGKEDYPGEYAVAEVSDRQLLRIVTSGRPAPEHLPRALFLLTRSKTSVSAVALSNVLEALYATPIPRPRLVALLHLRMTTARGPLGHVGDADPRLWIAAEMMRLTRVDRPADALSLFAARFQWVAMPTSDVWAAFRDHRPELVEAVAHGWGDQTIMEPARRSVPDLQTLRLAYHALVRMHGDDVERLTVDYREFLSFAKPAEPRTRLGPLSDQPVAAEPTAPADSASLFEDPLPAASILDPLFTPWSSPDLSYGLPEALRPGPLEWVPWVRGFARIDPKLGVAVLRDMRERGVKTDCRVYGHVFMRMVACGELDMAMGALDELVKIGGLSFEDGRAGGVAAPTAISQAERDFFPPVTAWLYVRLIRAMVTSANPEYSVALEDQMRAAGFQLTDIEKEEMVTVYHMRHVKQVRTARRRGILPRAQVFSPWGVPGDTQSPNVIYIPGELTGEQGRSYNQSEAPAKDSSNTLLEEGFPLRARARALAARHNHSRGRRGRKVATATVTADVAVTVTPDEAERARLLPGSDT